MTERASDLLSKLADRLSADPGESGLVAAESVRSLAPEILKVQKGGSVDDLVKTSGKFLELLFRSLNVDSRIPWVEYYAIAREASRRYAEKGIPLEALMEGLLLRGADWVQETLDLGLDEKRAKLDEVMAELEAKARRYRELARRSPTPG